jgi:hypothetical protein
LACAAAQAGNATTATMARAIHRIVRIIIFL